MPKLNEAHIQRTCTEYLELDGWRSLRTDPMSRRDWGKGFGELGMADYLYIRYHPRSYEFHHDREVPNGIGGWDKGVTAQAVVMWIEWKRIGGKPTIAQAEWHKAERAHGALTLVAGVDFPASIEGFMGWYRTSGLLRNQRLGAKIG